VKARTRAFPAKGAKTKSRLASDTRSPDKFGVKVIHRFAATRCCDGQCLPHSVGHDGAF
jgi:hypothetical protein